MNHASIKLPNGDFEVIYTKEDPMPGKVEVLINGKWYPRLPYHPYKIDFSATPRPAYHQKPGI